MGVAVDPGFRSNRRVYTCFLSNRAGSPDVRVVRWRMNAAVTALTDRADIVTGIPVTSGRHSGLPDAVRSRRSALDRYWRLRQPDGAPEPHVPGRQGAARRHQRPRPAPGTPPLPSTRGSTPTAIATCRASRSALGARRTPSNTAPTATTRSTGSSRARTTAGTLVRLSGSLFYDESRPMTDTTRHPVRGGPCGLRGTPPSLHREATSSADRYGRGGTAPSTMAVLKGQQLRSCASTTTVSRWNPVGAHHRPGSTARRGHAPVERRPVPRHRR